MSAVSKKALGLLKAYLAARDYQTKILGDGHYIFDPDETWRKANAEFCEARQKLLDYISALEVENAGLKEQRGRLVQVTKDIMADIDFAIAMGGKSDDADERAWAIIAEIEKEGKA